MRRLSLAAFAALGLLYAAPASADLVDNFNTENGGNFAFNYTGFQNFNVTTGSVDLIGNGNFDIYPGNGLYIDLNGSSGVSGSLASKALIGPGTYTFSFSLGNNPTPGTPNFVTVAIGSNYTEAFTLAGVQPLTTIVRTVVVTSAALLTFTTPASDSDNGGIIIDNISLVTPRAVPEPASVVMLGIAAVGSLLVARRRKAAPAQV